MSAVHALRFCSFLLTFFLRLYLKRFPFPSGFLFPYPFLFHFVPCWFDYVNNKFCEQTCTSSKKELFCTHGQTKQGQLQGMFTCTKLHTCHTLRVNVAGIQYRQQHRVNPFQLKAKAKRLYISNWRIRPRVAWSFREFHLNVAKHVTRIGVSSRPQKHER